MTTKSLHQKLIATYGIRVHKLPQALADPITAFQKLHVAYQVEWKKQYDFIDYENLSEEKVERVRLFLDKKRQFKEGNKSYSQLLAASEFVGKGKEGNKFILYLDEQRGYPVPEYIYQALLSVRPSSTTDQTDYAALFQQADAQISQQLLNFLKDHSNDLAYYLSGTEQLPASSQGVTNKLKVSLYDLLEKLIPNLVKLPTCRQFQTKFKEGKAYQISCISKSNEANYIDLVELQLDPKSLTIRKTQSYTFYIHEQLVQPILGLYYDEKGQISKELEVVGLMGGKPKNEAIELGLLEGLWELLLRIEKQKLGFEALLEGMELLRRQLSAL